MEEFINVTISGEKYQKYKEALEILNNNSVGINFHNSFSGNGWKIYTKDEAIKEMAEKYRIKSYHKNQIFETLKTEMYAKINSAVDQLLNIQTNLKSYSTEELHGKIEYIKNQLLDAL